MRLRESGPVAGPLYSVSEMRVGFKGSIYGTRPYVRFNDRGDVVYRGALWRGGKRVYAMPPSGPGNILGLNNRGELLIGGKGGELLVWSGGAVRKTGVNGEKMLGIAFNDRGDIAATEDVGPGPMQGAQRQRRWPVVHAVLYSGRKRTDLGALPETHSFRSFALVNNAGQVACTCNDRVFMGTRGKMIDLGMLPGYHAAEDIYLNGRGQVAGTLVGAQRLADGPTWADAFQQPFLWHNGTMYDLGTLKDAGKTCASGINDRGQVVGFAFYMHRERDQYVPLLWERGRRYDLNTLVPRAAGWKILRPLAINNRGQIVAEAARWDERRSPYSIMEESRLVLLNRI